MQLWNKQRRRAVRRAVTSMELYQVHARNGSVESAAWEGKGRRTAEERTPTPTD